MEFVGLAAHGDLRQFEVKLRSPAIFLQITKIVKFLSYVFKEIIKKRTVLADATASDIISELLIPYDSLVLVFVTKAALWG